MIMRVLHSAAAGRFYNWHGITKDMIMRVHSAAAGRF